MELLKDWNIDRKNNVDTISKKVIDLFAKWYKDNLIHVCGQHAGNVEEIFGLPYTSSGFCAELGCRCNSVWAYRLIPEYTLNGLALDQNGVVYAYFDNGNYEEDFLYVSIGVIDFDRSVTND